MTHTTSLEEARTALSAGDLRTVASILDDAVNRAELEEVRALLDLGVDPDLRDVVGDTPLINAAWVGSHQIVRLLLARGARPGAQGADGKTASERLLSNDGSWHADHDECVRILRRAHDAASE